MRTPLLTLALLVAVPYLHGQTSATTHVLPVSHGPAKYVAGPATAKKNLSDDEIAAIGRQRGIQEVDIPGFIRKWRNDESLSGASTTRNSQPAAPLNLANPGFETGAFTGWTGYIGDNTSSSAGPLNNQQPGIFSTTVDAPLTDMSARHTIMDTAAGNDPAGGFPIVPNSPTGFGNFVARLGQSYANYQGEELSQTYTVTAADSVLYLAYAVVLNDGGHAINEGGYFRYNVTDSMGGIIASRFDQSGSYSTPYDTSLADPSTHYLPWRIDTIHLGAFVGQPVTVEFITSGCIYGGHYGYCYVDLQPYTITGIHESTVDQFHLFPNPGNGEINLVMNSPENKTQPLVYNSLGALVHPVLTQTASGWQIDMSSQSAGMYYVQLTTATGVSTQRLVVK